MSDGLEVAQHKVYLQGETYGLQVATCSDPQLVSQPFPELQVPVVNSGQAEQKESFTQLQDILEKRYGLEICNGSKKKRSPTIRFRIIAACLLTLAFIAGTLGSLMANRLMTAGHQGSSGATPRLSSAPSAIPIHQLPLAGSLSIRMDCPSSDGQNYTTPTGEVYHKHCGNDWPAGGAAADGHGIVLDLLTVKTFTLNDCIDACSTYNSERPHVNCVGVTWGVTTAYLGNCWLKANIGIDQARMVDQRVSAKRLDTLR